ncbi:MAG: DNA/RNA non-specific endonuclease [Bacteroidota bacterium]
MKKIFPQPSLLFALLLFLSNCSLFEEEEVIPVDPVEIDETKGSEHLLLGNPSEAEAIEILANNYLSEKPQFALSYNDSRGIPNWVSWHLSSRWLGSTSRTDDFLPDFDLPFANNRIDRRDYSGSGFDRGHNCPSADRTSSRKDNAVTFLMSNVIPQAPEHNQKMWNEMEIFTRDQVRRNGNEVYVIMGNYGEGGEGRFGMEKRIGDDKQVAVPKYIWKVVVIIGEGDDDLSRIDERTRVIAVLTENLNRDVKEWHEYRVSVDAIEKETGLDLLSEVPEEIQAVIEAKVDNGPF